MNGYIRYMRAMIGHAPMILCGASVIVYKNNQILLQRRKDDGSWGYFGGAVELGEAVEDTAKRELFEESGLRTDKLRLFGVYSGEGMHHVYPNGDEVHNVDTVFICEDFSGTIKRESDETSDVRWFHTRDLPNNISGPTKRALADFIAQLQS